MKNVLNPLATTSLSKWKLLTQYVKVIKEFEKHDIYEYMFMDAHYVVVEILQGLHSQETLVLCLQLLRNGAQPIVEGTPEPEPNEQHVARLEMFKQAIRLLRDCEAKQLVLQVLQF